ncbi:MAG: class I SAM-dependent methyltransferase, partial [Candidatus Thorarchaeota archaeon]
DSTYDVVLCNLVLLNIPCLAEALFEFSRVLKTDGVLVFSIAHPAFNFYGPGTWEMGEKDHNTKRRKGLFFKVDQYFDEQEYQRFWKTRSGEKFPESISFFHRTLSTYIQALTESGLVISRIEEPQPVVDDDFFERERRIPFFLVVKARKLSD